ncbi:MAG: adenine deaminase [Candidatus Kapaibacteriota bacterium]|jgi:adenine deaminase
MMKFHISGKIVDVLERKIYPGTIYVENGVITNIKAEKNGKYSQYILPGFIDAHIHIESSLLSPAEFAKNAVKFGTVATISDPHEIANVCGIDGIKFMIDNGHQVPFKFFFGAPSCVPATPFETAGAKITANDIDLLFQHFQLHYLSEMMNYPGVISENPEVIAKINVAHNYGVPIDGHSPGLTGESLKKYISFGILTDHEATTYPEAEEKISNGMKILIREGSSAKNFDELLPLLSKYPDFVMFCTDDLHPFDLINGHINLLVKKAIHNGYDLFDVLQAVSLNPITHYNIPVGMLRVGEDADFIVVDNLNNFNIIETYIQGNLVYKNGSTLFEIGNYSTINNFNAKFKQNDDFVIKHESNSKIRIIEVIDGSLLTNQLIDYPKIHNGFIVSDTERDILKIAVVNRYENTKPSVGFIKNFGLIKGAVATSIAHDSHNIIVIGTTDEWITKAVNLVIEHKGGIAFVDENSEDILPLPIAGLMTNEDITFVAKKYNEIEGKVKSLGSRLASPLMTISFMSLLVIPSLKIGDRGLFDVNSFSFVNLFVD